MSGGVRRMAGGGRGISFDLDRARRRGRSTRVGLGRGRGRSTRPMGQAATAQATATGTAIRGMGIPGRPVGGAGGGPLRPMWGMGIPGGGARGGPLRPMRGHGHTGPRGSGIPGSLFARRRQAGAVKPGEALVDQARLLDGLGVGKGTVAVTDRVGHADQLSDEPAEALRDSVTLAGTLTDTGGTGQGVGAGGLVIPGRLTGGVLSGKASLVVHCSGKGLAGRVTGRSH